MSQEKKWKAEKTEDSQSSVEDAKDEEVRDRHPPTRIAPAKGELSNRVPNL